MELESPREACEAISGRLRWEAPRVPSGPVAGSFTRHAQAWLSLPRLDPRVKDWIVNGYMITPAQSTAARWESPQADTVPITKEQEEWR